MNLEVIAAGISAVLGLIGAIISYYRARQQRRESAPKVTLPSYQDRMKQLSADLARASSEVDKTLEEMETVSRKREAALNGLEIRLEDLSKREEEIQQRIETLKNVPLPAAEYFREMAEKGEKSSAARDYILFGSGVIVSTLITIILKLAFGI